MGESKRRKMIDPNYGKTRNKPRGFYESPSDEAIDRYLRDPELLAWIQSKTKWTEMRIKQLLNMMGERVKEDKQHDVRLFDTFTNTTTIGMNEGTWVLWVNIPIPGNVPRHEIAFALDNGILTLAELAPDWSKSAFDFELK